ncbi:MAG: hypothetical protein AB7N80_00295 [Bdellovibrionales bacterium]
MVRYRFWHIFLFLGLAAVLGCGQGLQGRSDGAEVLLPWPDAQGDYHFTKVVLSTLSSPQKMDGPAARIFWQVGGKKAGGFRGQPVKPHLTRRGRLWLATDVQSQQAIATYAIFERLQRFDRQLGFESRLAWPREVGFDIKIKTPEGSLHSNAAYDRAGDVVAVAAYSSSHESAGLPLAVNHGVLSHEHFHAHFAAVSGGRAGAAQFALSNRSLLGIVNRLVIGSWNEGLADLYATVFTGDPMFMRMSFVNQAQERALSLPVTALINWVDLKRMMDCTGPCLTATQMQGFQYVNGTALARWLYQWGLQLHPTNGPREVLSEVLRTLPQILNEALPVLDLQAIESDYFIESFLNKQNLPIPAESCRELRSKLVGRAAVFRGCP